MTTLRLAIDAAGMRAGAQQATTSLDQIQAASKRAVTDLRQLNTTISAGGSGGLLGGGTQVFRGLSTSADQASTSFSGMGNSLAVASSGLAISGRVQQLSTSMDTMTGSMRGASQGVLVLGAGLVDVSRLMTDFRSASGKAAGAGNLLAQVWKANPVLLIATALTAGAAALSLFGDSSKKAAADTRTLTDSIRELDKARGDSALLQRIGLGEDDPRSGFRSRAERLGQAALTIETGGKPIPFSDLKRLLPSYTAEQIAQIIGREGFIKTTLPGFGIGSRGIEGPLNVKAESAVEALLQAARFLAAQSRFQPEDAPSTSGIGAAPAAGRVIDESGEVRQQQLRVIDAERANTLQIELQAQVDQINRVRDAADEAGRALASAFFEAAEGGSSLRSVLGGLIQDISRIGQRIAIQQIGSAFANAFAPTATQGLQDRSTIPGGTGPQQIGSGSVG